jgi:hypothetical protein
MKNKKREKKFFGDRGGRQINFHWVSTNGEGIYVGRKSTAQKRMEAMREGNRRRQAAHYARQRDSGKKQLKLWVSPMQKKIFRAVAVLLASEEGAKIAQRVLLETVKRLREKTEK